MMSAMGPIRRWLGSMAIMASMSRPASAQPSSTQGEALEPVSIRVDGPPGCPSGEEFWQRLQLRAPGIRLARTGEPGRVFVVHFERSDTGTTIGRLRILDVEGSALEREVEGNTCSEVADALALIAAVGAQAPPSNDIPLGEGPPRERPARPRPPPPPAKPQPEVATSHPDRPHADRASGWTTVLRAEVSMHTQIIPAPLYGLGAGVEFAHEGASPWQLAGGALVEATLTATASTSDVAPNTEMTGQLIDMHFFASPLRLRTGPFDVRPYGSLDIGRLTLHGHGSGLQSEGQTAVVWVAVALVAEGDLRLGAHWALGAKLGAEVHPVTYQYEFTPREVYQVGAIGFIAGLAASFRFE